MYHDSRWQRGLLVILLWCSLATPALAADFLIYDGNKGTDIGFDNQTPVAPVGGNGGTTLGAQRRNALIYAARIVLSRVGSPVPVRIAASFDDSGASLDCSRTQGTLAYGGPTNYVYDFAGAPRHHTLYPLALANALAGRRLTDNSNATDVQLLFNGQLDDNDDQCLGGTDWYYGLDGDPGPNQLDFVATAVHEMVHGLGFGSTVALTNSDDADVGQFPLLSRGKRYPDIYSTFIQDLALPGQPLWTSMTAAQRADSLTAGPNIVWSSATTDSAAYGYLTAGLNQGRVELYAPSTIVPGSSISHWSDTLAPNQLMEPFESPDVSVLGGLGLATCALQDMGWQLIGGTRCPDVNSDTVADTSSSGRFVTAETVAATNGNDHDNGDHDAGGGGGCTMDSNARFDPIWCVMLGLAGGILIWRRRRAVG